MINHQSRQKTVSKVNWNRIDKNLYQQEIEKQLDNLSIDNYVEIHLDKAYCDINSLRERPFNLKGAGYVFFLKKYSDSQCC